MKKFALLIVYIYAFCCPLEFVLNVWFGSSVKLVAAAAVMVTAFYFLVEQKHTIKFTVFQFALLGWAGLEAASVLWTNVTGTTYDTLLSYLMMAAFVLLLSLFPFNKKEADALIMFYSLGSLVLAIVVLTMGKIDGSEFTGRVTVSVLGHNQDPNGLAALLLSASFYSLYKAIDNKKFRLLYLAAFLTQIFAIFYTGSRGGLVSFLAALIVFIFVKIPRNKRFLAFGIAGAFLIVGYSVLELVLSDGLFNRLFNVANYVNERGVGRIRIWTAALQELMKSPIIGFGTRSHLSYFDQVFGDEFAMHNTYLCVAFETGFIGLIMFMTTFFSTFINALKQKNALIVTIIFANLVAAFFLDSLYLRFLWNALIFGIVYNNAVLLEKSLKKSPDSKNTIEG